MVCREKLTIREILLVGKDKKQAILHFTVVDDAVEFLSSFIHAGTIRRVDDEDQALGTYTPRNQ